jgi:hypothetical protein
MLRTVVAEIWVIRAFCVGLSALELNFDAVTQAFGLGWDVAAPMALSKCRRVV